MIDTLVAAPKNWHVGVEGSFTRDGKEIELADLCAGGALLSLAEAEAIRALHPGEMLELAGVMVLRRRW